jgi:hypothetical protein
MPMVHFVGEIKLAKIVGNELIFKRQISMTWAIVPGYYLKYEISSITNSLTACCFPFQEIVYGL